MIGKSKVFKDNMIFGIWESLNQNHSGESLLDESLLDSQDKKSEFWSFLDETTKLTVTMSPIGADMVLQNQHLTSILNSEMTIIFKASSSEEPTWSVTKQGAVIVKSTHQTKILYPNSNVALYDHSSQTWTRTNSSGKTITTKTNENYEVIFWEELDQLSVTK